MEQATRRRNLVLRRMVVEGYLDPSELDRLTAEPIVLATREAPAGEAAYFNEEVRRALQETYGSEELYRGGLVVRTTLDPELQRIAERAVETGLAWLDDRLSRRSDGAERPAEPVQAALVAIEPSSGEILALVGGRDFEHSEFNRAMQAHRQPGSLFKPFVYAAALGRGWTLADTLLDEPTVFLDRRNPVPYQPENFSRGYHGTITLRSALEKSINIPTVKLLEQIGYDPVIDLARRLGVRSRLRPYPSLALGAFELSLLEVTSAYGAFANQGLLMQPHYVREITDGDGTTVFTARPDVTEAVSPQVAYLMNQVLTGVVRQGTGKTAGRVLERTLAGKTGTTDNNTDAWFVGYSRDLVVGVWVGYDEPRGLGHRETGARAALPIWTEFMREALRDRPDEPFAIPSGVTNVTVDRLNGCLPDDWADPGRRFAETFIVGTEPTRFCSLSEERLLLLPYPFQRYPLDVNGILRIPGNELESLLAREPQVQYDRRRGLLSMQGEALNARVPVTELPDTETDETPATENDLDVQSWTGTDGRPAVVVWFDDAT
jgi:membrane carboxypeptidase/penicillin-binding protein